MREISLDTETTGFEPSSGHRMVEIGCVELEGHLPTGNVFHFYLNPDRDMPAEAQKVHGLSSEFLADKPRFAEIADKLLAFLSNSPLVIHNAAFDMKFLNHELQRCGRPMLKMERAIDTVMMAREKFPGSPANLDALCRRFEIDLSGRELHGALLDAQLLADVYLELIGGRQSSLSLDAQAKNAGAGATAPRAANFPYRQFAPSHAEQQQHAEFLKQLQSPLWDAYPDAKENVADSA